MKNEILTKKIKNAEEKIATFAGPPEYFPAITIAISIKSCPSPIRVARTPKSINKKTYCAITPTAIP